MSRDAGEFESLRPVAAAAEEAGPERGRGQVRLESGVPNLRPRGVGELLDLAFEVLRSRFGTYVGIAALIWLPMRAAQPFIGMHQWETPNAGMFLGFFFNTGGALVLAFLEVSVLAALVAAHLEGRSITPFGALRHALSRLFSVGVIAVLGGMLTAVGYFCLCVPGVVLTWLLYLAPAVCVIENVGVAESISRSFELAGRRFLPWIPLALATFLLGLPFASVASVADTPEARAWMIENLSMPAFAFDWTMVVVTSLFNGVAAAIRGVVVTVWYFDCRARRDGADLGARLARAGTAWRTEPAA
ncbi:MAG: hypothetical protein ACKVXR_05520 [Planctomycetota bacterium]